MCLGRKSRGTGIARFPDVPVTVVTENPKLAADNRYMNSTTHRFGLRLAALIAVLSCTALAASPKVERIGPLAVNVVSDALRQSVEAKGYRVTLEDGWSAEFWLASNLKMEKKDVSGALYPELNDGEFVGVVRFPQGMSDYRGQNLPAGLYTLRYQMLPQDGNHMGVSPNPDFLLASPAAVDARPEQAYVLKKLVAMSAKSTGTNHPAVIALDAAGEAGTVKKEESGDVVFTVEVPTPAAAAVKFGIVIKGAAAQ